jgi:hypothetical protein
LWRVARSELRDGDAACVDQCQILATGCELEVRVRLGRRGQGRFVGGEDDQTFACGQGSAGGKYPLLQVRCVIGEKIGREIEPGGIRIIDLDPVGKITINIR